MAYLEFDGFVCQNFLGPTSLAGYQHTVYQLWTNETYGGVPFLIREKAAAHAPPPPTPIDSSVVLGSGLFHFCFDTVVEYYLSTYTRVFWCRAVRSERKVSGSRCFRFFFGAARWGRVVIEIRCLLGRPPSPPLSHSRYIESFVVEAHGGCACVNRITDWLRWDRTIWCGLYICVHVGMYT